MPRKKTNPTGGRGGRDKAGVASITYAAKRKNIPPAGLEAQGVVRETPRLRYEFNPHLPPELRSAPDAAAADRLPELLAAARERALSEDEARLLADALRRHEPWLEWSGKRERPWFEVEPVALHMHERVSTQAVVRVLARQDVQRGLFADPQLDYAKAVQFYRHDVDWANRMILGDSLQVMASLARRENLAGKVRMIYLDPPYGIRFASNFQPRLGQRDVKDRRQDLTREPEMVKAYRDTWTLGIHSYLAYLRDRLAMARELLADTGSIFVQISDENLHRVRCVLDEVFGAENFASVITLWKTSSATATRLATTCDYILWYAKDISRVRFHSLFIDKNPQDSSTGGSEYKFIHLPSGERRPSHKCSDDEALAGRRYRPSPMTSQSGGDSTRIPFVLHERTYKPGIGGWKSNSDGLTRLSRSERLIPRETSISFVRYLSDFPLMPVANLWTDLRWGFDASEKRYVVETNPRVIERCMLMTTDPGDLVLDPTCGSGTTAYVAEQWGRRWITVDTSRVALTLAKHRLMTAKYDYYRLREPNADDAARNPDGTWIAELDDAGRPAGGRRTFDCRTVPHVTLRSIARNTSLDPVFARHEPLLAEALAALNREAAKVAPDAKRKLAEKLAARHRADGAQAVTDADARRWLLPDAPPDALAPAPARQPLKALTARQAAKYRERIPRGAWRAWQAPFDADPDWPRPLREALAAYRAAWRAKMDEVNACIAANADVEELVDQPAVVRGTVRVAGPFTVEGVIAVEEGPDSPIGGAPGELDAFAPDDHPADETAANAEAHLDKILRLLKASGVDFPGNKTQRFERLDPAAGAPLIHAEGAWRNGAGAERSVAVSVGPEAGNVTAMQVEEVVRDANRRGYDDLVFAGFGFDAAAQDAIESAAHPKLRLHMALINPDAAMADLLKTQPGSQVFNVFSAPRVSGPTRQDDGDYVVEVEGMDVYDPAANAILPTAGERIAAWFVDTDYDGRTFCICQAFFPDKSKWTKLAKALGGAGVVDEGAFEALTGLRSVPFPRPSRLGPGEPWRVAVKVIDPRGVEGLRVLSEGGGWA